MAKTMSWEACIWILLMAFDVAACREFDLFTFTEQWPPAVCIKGQQENKTCIMSLLQSHWTIHGLWPDNYSGSNPRNCPGPNFSYPEISSLTEELLLYWPDIYTNSSQDGLWCHEWTCHGTCAQNISETKNEFLYFKKSLELRTRFDITDVLSKNNVLPTDAKPYTPNVFLDALKREFGHAPLLVCFEDQERKLILLYEVRICLDLQFNVIDCQKYTKNGTLFENNYELNRRYNGCGKTFYYIPL